MIDTPLDPKPCKSTLVSKSQCLCLGLGIAWVRGLAVDLLLKESVEEERCYTKQVGVLG